MNERESEQDWDEGKGIDLLVDGELDETRRRELLLRLENTPGAWRRCALAFLEAQAWRQASGAMLAEPLLVTPASLTVAVTSEPGASHSFWRSSWGNLLAVAASFGVAFALGAWYRSQDGDKLKLVVDGTGSRSAPDPDASVVSDAPADPNSYVTLLVDGVADGESNQMQLPVRAWGDIAADSFAQQPMAIPDSLVEEIEQAGHTVRQRRQLVPVDLQDGRRMIVPMDEVQIVPVSRTFQ
ncbi:MAG: hypothetical protein SGJ19_07905 [Planctomycetia bacterium]|nr:hypothetical protein [Planctomycetia bacterium]